MLKIQHVTLSFGQKKIFNDLSLNFEEGTITGLVAPNGTGKSTLINIILNNLTPQVGFVEYDGLRYKMSVILLDYIKKYVLSLIKVIYFHL